MDQATAFAHGVAWVAPDLSLYNVTSYAVYDTHLPEGFVLHATLAGGFYAALCLVLASILFSRRDFM